MELLCRGARCPVKPWWAAPSLTTMSHKGITMIVTVNDRPSTSLQLSFYAFLCHHDVNLSDLSCKLCWQSPIKPYLKWIMIWIQHGHLFIRQETLELCAWASGSPGSAPEPLPPQGSPRFSLVGEMSVSQWVLTSLLAFFDIGEGSLWLTSSPMNQSSLTLLLFSRIPEVIIDHHRTKTTAISHHLPSSTKLFTINNRHQHVTISMMLIIKQYQCDYH